MEVWTHFIPAIRDLTKPNENFKINWIQMAAFENQTVECAMETMKGYLAKKFELLTEVCPICLESLTEKEIKPFRSKDGFGHMYHMKC